MVVTLGRRTVKGVLVSTVFKHGALTKRKWTVQPDSTIYVSCCERRGGGRHTSNVVLLFKVAAPYTTFLVGLTASHGIGPSGLRFVVGLGGVASNEYVHLTNLIAMSPTAIA
jgi:hypothetical protein